MRACKYVVVPDEWHRGSVEYSKQGLAFSIFALFATGFMESLLASSFLDRWPDPSCMRAPNLWANRGGRDLPAGQHAGSGSAFGRS